MARALVTDPEGPGFKTQTQRVFETQTQRVLEICQTVAVHPVVNGYSTLFRTGEGEGDEEEAWYPASVTPVITGGSLLSNSHFSTWPLAMGTTYKLVITSEDRIRAQKRIYDSDS